MISCLILTRNEDLNLPQCLDSLKWCDDIVVFDSFSTDSTVEIAKRYNARVLQRHFDNERDHRAASLKLEFKYPWVYNPDADEVTTPELRDEIIETVKRTELAAVAYRVRFKTMFFGRWIKHSSLYPTWVVRLFRPEALSFERTINLRYIISGPEGQLQSHFEHHTFGKGLDAWIDKHNNYSHHEAHECLKSLAEAGLDWRAIFWGSPSGRRSALKELSFRLPCRPLLRFLYMYFVRLGFLDGLPGYHYCRLLAFYEYLIVLKIKEIERRRAGLAL